MLTPVKLSVKNYCQHTGRTITFKPGITGIMGRNGSGKSNLLRALQFALTGESCDRRSRGDMLKAGATSGFVELDVATEQGMAQIVRWVSSDQQSLKRDWVELALTRKNDINQWLSEAAGATAGGFDNLETYRFVPQGGLDKLLRMQRIPRMKLLYSLFGLDAAERAAAVVGEVRQDLLTFFNNNSRLEALRQEYTAITAELNKLKSMADEFTAALQSYKILSEQLAEKAALRKESDRAAELQQSETQLHKLETSIQNTEAELASVRQSLDSGMNGELVPDHILKLKQQMLASQKCPVCDRNVAGDKELEAKVLEQVAIADRRLAESGLLSRKAALEATLKASTHTKAGLEAQIAKLKTEKTIPDTEYNTLANMRASMTEGLTEVKTALKRIEWLEDRYTAVQQELETLEKEEQIRNNNEHAAKLLIEASAQLHPTGLPKLAFNDVLVAINEELDRQQELLGLPFRITLAEDLLFQVDHGSWKSSEKMLSGGQVVMASLALVLTLNKLLAPDLKVMAFDEPTVYLDRENIKILADALSRIADTVRDQHLCMLVTTNDPALRPAFEEVIELC